MRISMKKVIFALCMASLTATAAHAGSSTMSKGGKKMAVWCNNGGCYQAEKLSVFKKGPRKRVGPGGSANYKKLVAKMKARGWK